MTVGQNQTCTTIIITVNLETWEFILKLCKVKNHKDPQGWHLESHYDMCFITGNCGWLESFAPEGSLETLFLFPLVARGTDVTKQIIIGTPGTVLDWCFKQKLIDLTKIRVFVLDEADVMIDTQGFSDQSIRIQR